MLYTQQNVLYSEPLGSLLALQTLYSLGVWTVNFMNSDTDKAGTFKYTIRSVCMRCTSVMISSCFCFLAPCRGTKRSNKKSTIAGSMLANEIRAPPNSGLMRDDLTWRTYFDACASEVPWAPSAQEKKNTSRKLQSEKWVGEVGAEVGIVIAEVGVVIVAEIEIEEIAIVTVEVANHLAAVARPTSKAWSAWRWTTFLIV